MDETAEVIKVDESVEVVEVDADVAEEAVESIDAVEVEAAVEAEDAKEAVEADEAEDIHAVIDRLRGELSSLRRELSRRDDVYTRASAEFSEFMRLYPDVQILPLDYDPDVSFANIENRLQMLIMNEKSKSSLTK